MDDNNGVLFYGTELEEHVKQIKNLLGIGCNARVLIDSSFIQWAVRRNQDLFHSMETLIHSPTDFFITKCVTQSVSLRAWYRDVCSSTAEMRQMFGKMDALPSLCNHSFDYLDEHLCILQVLKNSINKGCFLASCEEKVYDFVQQALTTPIITVDDEGNLQVLPLTDLQLKRISGEEKSVKTDVFDKENDLWFGFSQDEVIEYDKEEGINTTEEENTLVVEEIRKRSSYTLRDLGFSSDESS